MTATAENTASPKYVVTKGSKTFTALINLHILILQAAKLTKFICIKYVSRKRQKICLCVSFFRKSLSRDRGRRISNPL